MNDDQLTRELTRRADAITVGPDWARSQLLPAVVAAIETEPQRVRTSRLAPLAGLAAVAAVLVLLVVAVPRLTPGPQATQDAVPTRASTIGAIGVREFQQRLASGELNGQTLLVNGRIEETMALGTPCTAGGLCLLGELSGTAPLVYVSARPVPTTDGDGDSSIAADSGWSSWRTFQTPIEGVLVLSVDENGEVGFIGHTPPDELVSAFSELQSDGVESLPLDEVHVVQGWLGGGAGPFCPPAVDSRRIADLPARFCGHTSWIADGPLGQEDRADVPDEALQVQDGAYDAWAPSPGVLRIGIWEPRAGAYVLARRLEGSGCPQNRGPCWQWNIVGRLTMTQPTDPAPVPTPNAQPALTDTHQQGDFVLTLSAGSATYSAGQPLDDVVASLAYVGPEPSILLSGSGSGPIGFGLEEVDGDRDFDGAVWTADCATRSLVRDQPTVVPYRPSGGFGADDPNADFYREFFRRAREGEIVLPEGSWRLSAVASIIVGPECDGPSVGLQASIIVDVLPERPPPDATPRVAGETFECEPSDARYVPRIVDETGLVERCVVAYWDLPVPTVLDRPEVSNIEPDRLHISWAGSPCAAATTFTLGEVTNGYTLESTVAATPCDGVLVGHFLVIELAAAIDSADVSVSPFQQVAHDPTSQLESAWWELAPHERPTAASTALDLIVYEVACASGQSPEGRVSAPEVTYGVDAVSVAFRISQLPMAGDCPTAPGAPVTVTLAEPLGERRLVDGGFRDTDVVIEHSPEFLALSTGRVDEMANERLHALAGPDACTSTVIFDREVPTQEQLDEMAAGLGGQSGFVAEGAAYLGDWLGASRALGALEAYEGRPKPWYIVAPAASLPIAATSDPSALVLASLDLFPTSGGRTIWYPAFYEATIVSPAPCAGPSPTPAPPEGSVVTCPYDLDATASPDVTVTDHTGLVSECLVSRGSGAPDEYVEVTTSGTAEDQITIRWQTRSRCHVLAEIEFWGPLERREPLDALRPHYVAAVNASAYPDITCLAEISSQSVTLILKTPIESDDVQAFVVEGQTGIDQHNPPDPDFVLTLTAGGTQPAATDPIDITATLTYVGPAREIAVTGNVGPAIGLEQLDGDLELYPSGHLLICPGPLELERDVPRTLSFTRPTVWPPKPPDMAFFDQYMHDGQLRLPPGTYRIFAASSFSVGEACTTDTVELRTGIVIHVR